MESVGLDVGAHGVDLDSGTRWEADVEADAVWIAEREPPRSLVGLDVQRPIGAADDQRERLVAATFPSSDDDGLVTLDAAQADVARDVVQAE